jgi:hypothetical protein
LGGEHNNKDDPSDNIDEYGEENDGEEKDMLQQV